MFLVFYYIFICCKYLRQVFLRGATYHHQIEALHVSWVLEGERLFRFRICSEIGGMVVVIDGYETIAIACILFHRKSTELHLNRLAYSGQRDFVHIEAVSLRRIDWHQPSTIASAVANIKTTFFFISPAKVQPLRTK